MASHDEQMNMRREKREQMRKKREAEQRRLRVALICAAVILVLGGIGIFVLSKSPKTPPLQPQQTQTETKPTEATEETKPENIFTQRSPITTIHIRAAGDLNITNAVVNSGISVGGYDFTNAFMDVATVLSEADLTVLNFEGNICGEPYGTETGSAPAQILTALRNAGVDMIQVANSYSIRNGLIGLNATLQAVRNAGLEPLGAYASPEEFRRSGGYTMVDINGIRVAFVAFTKGVGGMGMPAGNEACVNLMYKDYATKYNELDRDRIRAILKTVEAQKPDITIAMLHWGSEYNDTVSKAQEDITALMKKAGVDVIIGTHSHMVQRIDFDQKAGTLVAYSLGDFYGDAERGGTNYSIILDLEITKDEEAGTTKVTGYSYTPIFTLKASDCDGKHRVVRIETAMNAYLNNFVNKITAAANEAMIYALTRIEARINGK